MAAEDTTGKPIIVTAASAAYGRTLWQFLRSAERLGISSSFTFRAYDLGMSAAQRKRLEARFPWCEFASFDFSAYPPHVGLDAGSYAWKPIIIMQTLEGAGNAPVFWFDSATLFHSKLERPLAMLASRGIWTLRSQSPLYRKCDKRVIEALGVPAEVCHLAERAAGAIGFDPQNQVARQLAADWRRHALIADHIVPPNADACHKQDQSILNCLLLTAIGAGTLELDDEDIDISSPAPTTEITSRNIVKPGIPVWLDTPVRGAFTLYKTADRLAHQWQRFSKTRLNGSSRWIKEHFSVHVRDLARGIKVAIPSPDYGYYADPFLVCHEGRDWLFMEEFQYATDKGRLVVMELDESLNPAPPRVLQATNAAGSFDCHASFPHVFTANGRMLMIPETSERRSVDLYACEQWPDRWHLARRLLFDVDAADTMAMYDNGLWWLFTSIRSGSDDRHLKIFYTDDLLEGTLHPHSVNAARPRPDAPFGTGRCAGYLAAAPGNKLKRLIQSSRSYYGQGVAAMEITRLTPDAFAEQPTAVIEALPVTLEGFRSHHISRAGNLMAFDTRDRVRKLSWL
jgi:hypothetical protein